MAVLPIPLHELTWNITLVDSLPNPNDCALEEGFHDFLTYIQPSTTSSTPGRPVDLASLTNSIILYARRIPARSKQEHR